MRSLLSLSLLFLLSHCFAQQNWSVGDFRPDVFVKNDGQFNSQDENAVLFSCRIGTVDFFFTKSGYYAEYAVYFDAHEEHERFEFERAERGLPIKPRPKNTWSVTFANSNPAVIVDGLDKQSFTFNYGISAGNTILAPTFQKIIYKNIYPGIDMAFEFRDDNGFKYDIIVHPGGNVNDIQFIYPTDALLSQTANQKVEMINDQFHFQESIPASFLQEDEKAINVLHEISANTISFKADTYDKSKTLVIDLWTIVVSPFTTLDDFYKVDYDNAGNVWAIGEHGNEVVKYDNTGAFQWLYTGGAAGFFFMEIL